MIEDVTDVKRAELGQRFLAEAGAVLASGLDYEQTLGKVADLAVPRLADWCSVTLPATASGCAASLSRTSTRPSVAFAPEYDRALAERRSTPPIGRRAGPARRLAQLIGPLDDALLEQPIADPEQRATLRASACAG